MAKKHSRRERKLEKEKALRRQARQAGIKHYNTLTQADLQRIAQKQANAQANRRREAEKRKAQREATRRKKVKYLEEIGLNPFNYKLKDIDSIKIKDIESKNVSRETYPVFWEGMFSYNEVRPLKNGEEFYFSFQDFSGNLDFEELIKELQNKSVDWLINRINELARMRKTHKKGGKHDSSGKAGQYKMMVGKHVTILDYNRETRTESRNMKNKLKRDAWKTHPTGNNTGWQVLTSNTGRVGFSEMSGKSLLTIGVAIMDNVTEDDRVSFYRSFYNAVGKHFPEMLNDLIPPTIKD